jgi:hypothetical protein
LAVSVLLDGRPILGYAPAVVVAGRTYAPIAPYATSIAQALSYEGKVLVIERDARQVRVRMLEVVTPDALDWDYVPIASLLRGLGASVTYDSAKHVLEVRTAHDAEVQTPAPFNPSEPQVAPRDVFTPAPIETRAPQWHGPPVPRRTPLPYPVPT